MFVPFGNTIWKTDQSEKRRTGITRMPNNRVVKDSFPGGKRSLTVFHGDEKMPGGTF